MTLKKLFVIACAVLSCVMASAQISYNGYMLNIGGAAPNGRFNFAINNHTGLYWTYDSSKFLMFDLTSTYPRIAGTGNQIVFYNTFTSTFNSIQVANVYNYSDERAKTNIKNLDSGLNTILGLRPVSYDWKQNNENSRSISVGNENNSFGPNEDNRKQYGFLAQELEQVLPDAVATDENGTKLINYTAIIPHLVQSIQELQAVVAEQATIIENLSSTPIETRSAVSLNKIVNCSPNPTQGNITFDYTLSESATVVEILVSDLSGNLKSTIDCEQSSSSATKDLSSLKDGIYIATLSVNGEIKDSKQFIIRK